jgi:hypothetical protein
LEYCRSHQNYFRDYDPAIGRYVESDPVGQLLYFNFSKSNMRVAAGLKLGYWNHLYNYADSKPTSEKDRTGLGSWELLQEVLGDKIPEMVTPATLARAVSAVCIAQACATGIKSLSPIDAMGNCISIFDELSKHNGGPGWIGLVNALAGNGEVVSDCGDRCSEGVKKAAEKSSGCPNCGKQ